MYFFFDFIENYPLRLFFLVDKIKLLSSNGP